MKALMTPIFQAPQKAAAREAKGPGRAGAGANFSSYMEGKAASRRSDKNTVLGGGGAEQSRNASAAGRREKGPEKSGGEESASIAGLLAEFVSDLKNAAAEKDLRPGEWAFTLPDASLVQKIAADAGMSESQLAALMEKTERQDGRFVLTDFLDAFARHFQDMRVDQPVTAPETDLPLLQILLERLGVPAVEAGRIGEAAVRGDNTLDLEKFLAGLQDLHGENFTTLSQVEAEQLLDLLAAAGVSHSQQRSVLPELFPVWQGEEHADRSVLLSLDRLKNMLEQAVNDARATRLQADLPAFLDDLQEVLNQSGFQLRGSGWSPVIQEAVVSVFEKLMESIDLARVRIQQANSSAAMDRANGEAALEAMAVVDEEPAPIPGNGVLFPLGKGGGGERPAAGKEGLVLADGNDPGETEGGMLQSEAAGGTRSIGGGTAQAGGARPFFFVANMPPGLQQQAFAQISQGVLSGLRSQEHHLVMTLYPKELGEVKVELLVRNEQVAVSFAMENVRVKEVLERNMEEFKENMERQGFILGKCMVSVNDRREGGEAWQQFQAAWQEQGRGERRRLTLADLADDVLYQTARRGNSRENGVDLFA